MTTSKEQDCTDAAPSSAGGGSPPPVEGGWDFADRLIDRIASGNWNWAKTGQVAALCLVFVGCLGILAWTAHEWPGWPGWAVGLGAGASGTSFGVAAYRRHLRRHRRR